MRAHVLAADSPESAKCTPEAKIRDHDGLGTTPSASKRPDAFAELSRLFLAALLALARTGEADQACRLGAAAWSAIRHDHPREADRLTAALHALVRSLRDGQPFNKETTMTNQQILDVRARIPAERHRAIFETYGRLARGEAFILVNDHDPKPLYYQFDAEHHGEFSWRYLEQGPETWRVEIGRPAHAERPKQ